MSTLDQFNNTKNAFVSSKQGYIHIETIQSFTKQTNNHVNITMSTQIPNGRHIQDINKPNKNNTQCFANLQISATLLQERYHCDES